MNPKEGLRAVARNPWVQRGVLITTVLLSSEACIPRPETRPTPPPAPTSRPTEVLKPTPTEVPIIAVDAVKPDNLTGIEVKRGEILVFQASGTWCMGFGECGGPDGIRFPAPNEPGVIVPKEKIGTLLGAIKTKESPDGHIIFTIGRSREVEAEADGSLILLMNERAGYYRDNSGSLAVRIGKGKGSLGLVQTPQLTPTETPKPVEKGVMGDWRFTPLSVEEVRKYTFPETPLREGYKRLSITLAVQNLSQQLKNWAMADQDVAFSVQSGDFSYPERGSVEGYFLVNRWGFKIPPKYTLPYVVRNIDVPTKARDLKLVTTSKNRNQQLIWDLEKDFPPLGETRKVEYRSPDKKSLKQLGESIEQGPLRMTPLQAVLTIGCDLMNDKARWYMGLRFEIENRYGYDILPLPAFEIFDKDGRIWGIDSIWNEGYSSFSVIPPGMTKIFLGMGSVGPEAKIPWDRTRCRLPVDFPSPPTELIFTALLSPPRNVPTEEKWAMYDLGNPPIIPINPTEPYQSAHIRIEDYFTKAK